MKKFKKFLVGFIALYLFCLGFLYSQQRSMMYYPNKSRPDISKLKAVNVDIVSVTTADDIKLEGWYLPTSSNSKPVILFFHGNAGNIAHRLHKALRLVMNGYSVLLAEYRGFGGNLGEPTEQGFYSDARAYLKWLEYNKKILPKNIIIYGESIGTGVAVQMATENIFKGIVLESPYSSTVDVASNAYPIFPIELLMKDKYKSVDKIGSINAPLLIVHGTRDMVIPIKFAKKLYSKAIEPKRFVEITVAGHNDLYEFGAFEKILEFTNKNIDIIQ